MANEKNAATQKGGGGWMALAIDKGGKNFDKLSAAEKVALDSAKDKLADGRPRFTGEELTSLKAVHKRFA